MRLAVAAAVLSFAAVVFVVWTRSETRSEIAELRGAVESLRLQARGREDAAVVERRDRTEQPVTTQQPVATEQPVTTEQPFRSLGEAMGLGWKWASPEDIINRLDRATLTYFLVNLGARNGEYKDKGVPDPANRMWHEGDRRWRQAGLAVEGEAAPCTQMKRRFVRHGIKVAVECTFASPANIVSVFERNKVPAKPDLLKIDIDSVDCPMLDAILSAYRPSYINMEVNFDIPPPLVFQLDDSPEVRKDWFWRRSQTQSFRAFYGCSLVRISQLARHHRYTLLQAYRNDVDLVPDEIAPRFGNATNDLATLFRVGIWGNMCAEGNTLLGDKELCKQWAHMEPAAVMASLRDLIATLPARAQQVPYVLKLADAAL